MTDPMRPRQPRVIAYANPDAPDPMRFVQVVMIPMVHRDVPGYPMFVVCHGASDAEARRQAEWMVGEWAKGAERRAAAASAKAVRAMKAKALRT